MNSPTNPFTTSALTQRLATAALRAAPRRAWLFLAGVVALSLALAGAGLFARYVRQQLVAAPPLPIIIIATPAPLPGGYANPPRLAPTAAPPAVLPALYDYRDASTATTIDGRRIACVVGTAEDGAWQLVAIDVCQHDASNVWIIAELLPPNTPIASSADLTPRTPAPAIASEPGYRVANQEPAAQPPEPAATELPPIFILPGERVSAADFRDPGCSPFVGYLPGSWCYRGPVRP